ncbi:uncharacterized protein LOC105424896 isoform X3 [Pogonomyrmex barbatus]|uniref:Uncharacterized protein LOC105424896 isoform X3 n=1 Tax=Pogonomyrmex barbatus TaxID=144034 RepID=A0A6I9VZ20_9HYME|nr:uncharacterized protein LOC105424896 isoform X3 [Pogonomyrmex barbatus]
MVALVARMKKHVKTCNTTLINVDVDEDSTSDSSSIRSRSPSCITADTLPSSSSSTSKCTKSISMLTESKLRSTNTNIESFVIKTSIANRKNLTYK